MSAETPSSHSVLSERPISDDPISMAGVFEQLGGAIWEYDPESSRFTSIEFDGNMFLGWAQSEWLSLELWPARIHPGDRSRVISKSRSLRTHRKNIDVEYRFQSATLDYRWVRELSNITEARDGRTLIRGLFFDVTEFQAAHGLVPEREHQYRKLVDALPDAFLIQQDNEIVFANPAAHVVFGDGNETTLVGTHVDEIFRDRHHATARINALESGGQKVCTSSEVVRSLSGRNYDAEIVSCQTIWGSKPAIQSVVRDMSWLSELLTLLREEKNLGKLVLDHIGDGVCVIDENGQVKSLNPAAEHILGVRKNEYVNTPASELLHVNKQLIGNRAETEDDTILQTSNFDITHIRQSDGAALELHIECNPIHSNKGFIGDVVTIRDLTTQKQSEAEIIKLTRAIEQSPIGVVVTDPMGNMVYVNSHFCTIAGVDINDFYGTPCPLLSKENINAETHSDIWATLEENQNWEGDISNYRLDDQRVWIRGLVSSLRGGDGQVTNYLGMYSDITAEKRAQATQKATEHQISAIFNAIGNAIFIMAENGTIESANPASADLLGYDDEEFQTCSVNHIIPDLNFNHSEFPWNRSNERTDPADIGVSYGREHLAINKNGDEIPVLLNISSIPQPEWEFDDRRARQRQKYICSLQDISDLKNAQSAIENAQKMDALGQLTGGLAHDFNNLLGIVIGNLDLADDEIKDTPPLSNYIATALRAALRGADLTRSLLDFSRSSAIDTETVDANDVIQELEAIIKPAFTSRVKFDIDLAEELWRTSLNRSEFLSALMNLIFNARDAMPNGGAISITTRNFKNVFPIAVAQGICPPGEYVRINVSDTGTGIKQDAIDKIFEPFYSTKQKGKGTGLGLSAVFGFVQRAGGWIQLASTPGEGTSISFLIPRSSEPIQNEETAKVAKLTVGQKNEELLVVDDEPELAEFCWFALKNAGYNVHLALSGTEALDVLAKNPNISTIVSDILMPGELDGIDLCGRVAEINDQIRVILTTGYTEKLDASHVLPKNCDELLLKPFRASELLESVNKVLSVKN